MARLTAGVACFQLLWWPLERMLSSLLTEIVAFFLAAARRSKQVMMLMAVVLLLFEPSGLEMAVLVAALLVGFELPLRSRSASWSPIGSSRRFSRPRVSAAGSAFCFGVPTYLGVALFVEVWLYAEGPLGL